MGSRGPRRASPWPSLSLAAPKVRGLASNQGPNASDFAVTTPSVVPANSRQAEPSSCTDRHHPRCCFCRRGRRVRCRCRYACTSVSPSLPCSTRAAFEPCLEGTRRTVRWPSTARSTRPSFCFVSLTRCSVKHRTRLNRFYKVVPLRRHVRKLTPFHRHLSTPSHLTFWQGIVLVYGICVARVLKG